MSRPMGHAHVVVGAGGAAGARTVTTAITEFPFGFESSSVLISNDGAEDLRVYLDDPSGDPHHASRPYITIAAGDGLPLDGHMARSIWLAAAANTTTIEVIAFERRS